VVFKYAKMRFRPGLCLGLHWISGELTTLDPWSAVKRHPSPHPTSRGARHSVPRYFGGIAPKYFSLEPCLAAVHAGHGLVVVRTFVASAKSSRILRFDTAQLRHTNAKGWEQPPRLWDIANVPHVGEVNWTGRPTFYW